MAMGMQVAPGGVGDLLLFGYWTTQMGRDTLLAITNTDTAMDAAVHVRILEGKASAEVRDFTVCMSAGDVWTAAIMTDGAGAVTFDGREPRFGYVVYKQMRCLRMVRC